MKADLHVHTCLSPCGDVTMTPDVFLEILPRSGIGAIAITDHNSARNVPAFERTLRKVGILVVPGIEITTREEVHVLGYFGNLEDALLVSEIVWNSLPDIEFDPEVFGYQVLVDEGGEFVGFERKPLFMACDLGLKDAIDLISSHGGIPVLAHVDRTFGVEVQLGFVPEDVRLVEVRKRETYLRLRSKHKILTSSDAHFPQEIGSRYVVLSDDPFDAIGSGDFRNIWEMER